MLQSPSGARAREKAEGTACTLIGQVLGVSATGDLRNALLRGAYNLGKFVCGGGSFFMSSLPRTLVSCAAVLPEERLRTRRVKDELRDNLTATACQRRRTSVPGIVGYDDTVVPQIINAILSRHNFILLGLRGSQEPHPARVEPLCSIPTCRISPDAKFTTTPTPDLSPLPRRSCASRGYSPVAYLSPDDRYVEKLAYARRDDCRFVGDIDPIKAARGGHELSAN